MAVGSGTVWERVQLRVGSFGWTSGVKQWDGEPAGCMASLPTWLSC